MRAIRSLLMLVVLMTVLVGLLVSAVGYFIIERGTALQITKLAEEQGIGYSQLLAGAIEGSLRNRRFVESRAQVMRMTLNKLVKNAYLLDEKLIIKYSTDLTRIGDTIEYINVIGFQDKLERSRRQISPVTIFDSRTNSFWVSVPVRLPPTAKTLISSTRGLLLVEYNFAAWKSIARDYTARNVVAAVGLVSLLGAVLLLFFWALVTRRIQRMTVAAEQMAAGEFGVQIGGSGKDEIGILGASLNALTTQLAAQRADLERQKHLIGMAGEVARFGGWRYETEGDRLNWSAEIGPVVDEPHGFVPHPDFEFSYFEGEERVRIEMLRRRCLENGEPYDSVFELKTAKGRRIWARAVGHPYKAADGTILGAFGALQDVTELQEIRAKEAEQRQIAAEAQKSESIGRLTEGVAHDFNNLLAVIMANLELLREDLDLSQGDERAEMLQSALNAVSRGAGLTRNLLAFARRAPLMPQRVDINDLVRSTQQIASRTLPAPIEMNASLPANLWAVEADRASIESALLNLIVNAAHAMPKGGQITLETANISIEDDYISSRKEAIPPGHYVMVAVSDTGTGIPPEQLPRIFEPFYTTKGPNGGSGLGLSMVQGFVKQSGGTVRVYSEPGTGTTFKLLFPAMRDLTNAHAIEDVRRDDFRSEGQRLLVVEDEPDVLSALEKTLRRAGYEVVTAASGDLAAALFERDQAFDLVVSDIVMPGDLQGPQLVRTLRETRPDIPAVFLSGYASEATVHGNGLLPTDIRLMKPLQRVELLAAVARALKDARNAT